LNHVRDHDKFVNLKDKNTKSGSDLNLNKLNIQTSNDCLYIIPIMNDQHLNDVMNSKKILVVPMNYLDRWKPDLSRFNVNKDQRNAINETAIG